MYRRSTITVDLHHHNVPSQFLAFVSLWAFREPIPQHLDHQEETRSRFLGRSRTRQLRTPSGRLLSVCLAAGCPANRSTWRTGKPWGCPCRDSVPRAECLWVSDDLAAQPHRRQAWVFVPSPSDGPRALHGCQVRCARANGYRWRRSELWGCSKESSIW